jgi:hypothetical protein
VRNARRGLAAVVAVSVSGVAGCAPATSSPTAAARPSAGPSISSAPTASPSPAPTGLLAEIEVQRVDPELTDTILEFASDGGSVIFSSGIAEDAGPNAGPDLWHIRADADQQAELLWRNPERDHSIVKLAGDLGTIAFVDIPLDGQRAWHLWLLPRGEEDPILLDAHPGDEEVSSLVPSFHIQESTIAWTAFDIGPDGPVSQLLWAQAPGWEPIVVLERPAARAELWFPWLDSGRVVYCEVRYSADRTSDDRSVHLLELGQPGAEPERLDSSDLATMPVLVGDLVLWKEADRGFSMFNWGKMVRFELGGPGPSALDTRPHDYVNYPSAGSRFVAWWGANAFQFVVYDMLEDRPIVIESYTGASGTNVLRPHVSSDLLVWLYVVGEGPDSYAELRYAFLPMVRPLP